ncbi:MAG: ATP-binding protein [Oscillospiraceae bacterium]|nr:ATP-binding protein [Oscillospiraceae bacterium]
MLAYVVQSLPDLSLNKYQVFADSGIDGMLEAQTKFINQLHSILMIGNVRAHFLFHYSPNLEAGNKLKIILLFSNTEVGSDYSERLNQIISASNICNYFNFKRVPSGNGYNYNGKSYRFMSVLHKKERVLSTIINDEEKKFYVVPSWEINSNARLINMIKLIQSFNVECCYRVDLYTVSDLEETIHRSFEKPLLFLRNVGSKWHGISDLTKYHRNNRDPNADETLHQYEQWLKNVDASPVFRCRISALSDDKQISQLVLNSTITECIQQGNAVTKTAEGQFHLLSLIDEIPNGLHIQDAPQSLNNWTTTFTSEEIASFCRLPVLYDGENIELPKETAAKQEGKGIVIGKDKNGYDVIIPLKHFSKHMFVCGVPGSGKTNTMLHIANNLWNSTIIDKDNHNKKQPCHIPFLVLEPAKREYRELALFDIPELLVFSPSACTNFPICINPFEFPLGLTLSEHIGKLCQVFEGAFPIAPPAPFILDKAIQTIYENKGWNYSDINIGTKPYPIMQELYDQFEKELQTTNYDSEIQGNIRSVLEMRIGSLLRREMRDIFNAEKSTLSPEEWLTKPVVIELEALGEGPANFVTLLLCTLIRETLKADPLKDKEKPLRHVIFIEEAHNLIAPESQVKDGMNSNPKVAATAFIVKMLAEVRALREGIIIADQLPTAMVPEVIKNTNIKLVHRLTAGDDRELVGSTMSASGLQMENIATYISGQALLTYEKMLRPFEIQVHKEEKHGKDTPDDDELFKLMMEKPAFKQIKVKIATDKFNRLKNQITALVREETSEIEEFLKIEIDNSIMPKQVDAYLKSLTKLFICLMQEQNRLLIQMNDVIKYVSYLNRDEITDYYAILMTVGQRFRKEYIIFNQKINAIIKGKGNSYGKQKY